MEKLDVAAAKAARKGHPYQTNEAFENSLQTATAATKRAEARSAEAHAKGDEDYYELRKQWSGAIIGWICVLIVFHIFLTILIGAEILNFKEYQWFITAVTVETFLQVIGMGLIAVKFLFSENGKPPPSDN